MLHVIEGKGISCVDVSKKFLISLLVARCGREGHLEWRAARVREES
jgi:hypothetical protein